MRVLFLAEFDPAGVMTGWRDYLRQYTNVECYVAIKRATLFPVFPDAIMRGKPDIIVVCPGIGDGASAQVIDSFDPSLPTWVEDQLKLHPHALRVALFHGSRQTWRFVKEHAAFFQTHGYTLAATTLDYATEMEPAYYLPPAVSFDSKRAPLRKDGEQLRLVHSPSDPGFCSTKEILYAAITSGASVSYQMGRYHTDVIKAKLACHAGADHLRGSFSVNTLENAALGLVPLVALKPRYAAELEANGFPRPPWPLVYGEETLIARIREFVNDESLTRQFQNEAFEYHHEHFAPKKIVQRLAEWFQYLLDLRAAA